MILDENFWYWLAGLLEGEGCFRLPPPCEPGYPRISLRMRDLDVVQKVAEKFGINYICATKPQFEHHSTIHQLTIRGSKALLTMGTIYPIMGERRKSQIERVFASVAKSPDPVIEIKIPLLDSEKELYWLAGLLEGEGSFQAPAPSDPNRPLIQLWMTDEDIVKRVSEMWGIKYHHYDRDRENVKRAYSLVMRGSRAVALMEKLKPLMGKRRQEQIQKAINSYEPHKRQVVTPDQVREIRKRLKAGKKRTQLAEEYHVNYWVIKEIHTRKSWAWVED